MIIDTINDEVSEKMIVAMRGRNPEHPTDRTPGIHTEQRLEMNKEKINKVGQISNEGSQCGTVVSDEGLAPTLSAGTHGYANAHVCTKYRIRKLTPKECWRLMGYTDTDFEKAAEVNSNTQLYRESGNAIVKQVMMAIFLQMGIKGLKKWEERSKEEKAELIRGSIYDKADFQ